MADLHTLPRLYIPDTLSDGASVPIGGKQAHYLGTVLRLQNGDKIRLFNGTDGEWLGIISCIKTNKKRENTINVVLGEMLRPQKAEPDLWLCCAPIRKAHFDFTVMKATELGVAKIQPLITARTQVREINTERLLSIAIEAAEQSERLNIPTISAPISLDDLVGNWPKERLPLICAETGDAEPIGNALTKKSPTSDRVAVVTGPEGGFEMQELEKLKALPKAVALRLGPRILRADTAALAALCCWQSTCGDWK